MPRSSTAITLVLISTAAILSGYEAMQRRAANSYDSYDDDTGGDYGPDALYPTTGPATRSSRGRGYSSSHTYHHYWYSSGGSTYQSGSSSSPGRGTSGARSGTSRGGF